MDLTCLISSPQSPTSTANLVTTVAYRQSPHSVTSVTTFLSLPFTLRRRIYALAGLVRVCPIDLNHEGWGKERYLQRCIASLNRTFADWDRYTERRGSTFSLRDEIADICCFYRCKRSGGHAIFPGLGGVDCLCGPLPIGLLLVSRAIYSEVMTILYSENQFKICRTAPRGLTALFRMSPAALKVITYLHIRLNNCGCVPGHICSIDQRRNRPFLHPRPSCHRSCKCGIELPLSSQDAELEPLLLEWQNLNSHLARHLNPHQLRLSVVCDTLDQQVAHQIIQPIQGLPLLSSCAIRLGQSPNPRLRLLAETATRHATGQPPIPSTIFPWQDLPSEIQLRILSYSNLVAPRVIEWIEGYGVGPSICCQQCTDSLETCCCPGLHAAFSSLGCQCWKWLVELSSSNSFSVSSLHRRVRAAEHSPRKHRSALIFLQSIPRDALAHIRSIRIVFNEFWIDDLSAGTQSLTNWIATLAFVQQNLSLAQLHLTVCTKSALENSGFNDETWIDNEDVEWKFYQRLAEPMAVLRGIGSFRIPFPPPLDSARAAQNLFRQRQLQIQILGSVDQAFSTATTRSGQGHPDYGQPKEEYQ